MTPTHFLFSVSIFVVFQLMINISSGTKCTSVLNRNEIHELTMKEPCIEKYTARCGWLSLDYCTFYRQNTCDKKKNVTVTIYYHKTECCKGYYEAKKGTCIKKQPGVVYKIKPSPVPSPASVDPDFVKEVPLLHREPEKKSEITGGGYAGIACGLLLIISITVFTIMAIRKKKRRKNADKEDPTQQVLYVGRSNNENQSPARASGVRIQGTSQHSREATPCSSRMVTPPTSPVKSQPAEAACLVSNDTTDDIPETDI